MWSELIVNNRDLVLNMPLLILTAGALFIMLFEVFLSEKWPRAILTCVVLAVALACVHLNYRAGGYDVATTSSWGMLYADRFSAFISVVVLIGSIFMLLMGADKLDELGIEYQSEYYCMFLLSAVGAILFATASELITMFLGLETMSMALYCLCGAALGSRRSAEAALKYFLLGSFSSAFFLYGIAIIYGLTGSTFITDIVASLDGANSHMLLLAIGLVFVGIVFKIGGVPFHFWAPDVYEGAPTSVTAYMACVIKAVSVAAAIRLFWVMFHSQYPLWNGALWYVAAATMVVGNLIAIRQRSVKRMLAYSSIAHAGYMLVGLLTPGGPFNSLSASFSGGPAILYYMISYTAMTMGAFAIVMVIESPHLGRRDPDDIVRFNGLSAREPMLAALMALFMLALAGLPPGMAGLLGKFYLFSAAVKADFIGLVVIGVLSSAVSCYYYLRVIVAMYFIDSQDSAYSRKPLGVPLGGVLVLCAAGTVLLGLFPSAIYDKAVLVISSL